ncbi:hypothetical protein [Francisella philomiragia]|uniref:Uncharacterized protein n=1 Tax=Francisella philomiragia TaxID=28110 RepID=A0A0B6D303_9GAMM|nr:hypothetical protein [Francisella philomiragia]AJI53261.1 hypothetical protein LA55_662 [Francisella philomiragia]
MKSNLINADEIISMFDAEVFKEAVEELEQNEILFEGQFPFLDDSSMRDRNLNAQKEIFKKFGYCNPNDIHNLSFEVSEEGWMHCFCVFGNHFEKIEDVRNAVIKYFKK